MKRALSIVAALSLAAACARPAPATPKELEDRVARLEQILAKNAEALAFLAKVWETQQTQQQAQEDSEPAPDAVFGVAIADDVAAGLVEGPPTAYVTIVKAFDFACPHCKRSAAVVSELVKDYGGKLRVVYKNLVVHRDTAMAAHLASCAAAKQGKYLAFKTAFWDQGFGAYAASGGRDEAAMQVPKILEIARGVGLDPRKLQADMDGPACKALIAADMAELQKFKVDGTPAFFINGMLVVGGMDKAEMKAIVDARLAVAEASGVPAAQYYDREILGKGEKQFRSKTQPKPAP